MVRRMTATRWVSPQTKFRVDVADYCDLKLKAIACHASQISDSSFFGNMSLEIFQMMFGHEWFKKVGESGPPRDVWLFD